MSENAEKVRLHYEARLKYLEDLYLLVGLAAENLSRFDQTFRTEQVDVRVDLISDYLREQAKDESWLSFILLSVFAAGAGVVIAPLLAEFLVAGSVLLRATVRRRLGVSASAMTFADARQLVSTYLKNESRRSVIQEVGQDVAGEGAGGLISPGPPTTRPLFREGERIRSVKHIADIVKISITDHAQQLSGLRSLWAEMAEAGEWDRLAAALSDADNWIRDAVAMSQKIVGSSSKSNPIIDAYDPQSLVERAVDAFGLSGATMATRAEQLANYWALAIVSMSTEVGSLYTVKKHAYVYPDDSDDAERYGPGYSVNGQRVLDRLVLREPTTTALTRVLMSPPEYLRSFSELARESKIRISLTFFSDEESRERWLRYYHREVAARLLAQAMSSIVLVETFRRIAAYVRRAVGRR